MDKLLNFMRYWQAGGESEKTSMRVKAAHTQMTADGIWRGGRRPFGYKLVHQGRIGKKNRPLYDLTIDEVEGPIVQEVFNLLGQRGFGTLRAANFLNAKYPQLGKVWTAQTVRSMIRNPLYTGRMHMNDTLSAPLEHLRLVDDSQFDFCQHIIKERIPFKYPQARQAENDSLPPEVMTKASVYGATLLSGLLYCAHCGKKLVGGYCTKQRANGAYHRPIYRCYNGAVKAKECDGQSVYSAMKIEGAVLEVIRQYFCNFQRSVDTVWKEQARRQLRSKRGAALREAQASLEKLRRQQISLRQEVLKSLAGESAFDTDLLKEMLDENKEAIAKAEATIAECTADKETEAARLAYLSEQYRNISDWAAEFDMATNDEKKMILARIIQKITVDKDYHITITLYVSLEDFQQQVQGIPADVEIGEAQRCIETIAS